MAGQLRGTTHRPLKTVAPARGKERRFEAFWTMRRPYPPPRACANQIAPMYNDYNQSLHLVLKTLLSADPYDDGFPDDLMVTPETGRDDRIFRIFFGLYTGNGSYLAELRNINSTAFKNRESYIGKECVLLIERWQMDTAKALTSPAIRQAFITVARHRLGFTQKGGQTV
jgi:hypothetical protein